jgi:hypothetical protein
VKVWGTSRKARSYVLERFRRASCCPNDGYSYNLKNEGYVTVLGDSVLVVSHPKDGLKAHDLLELRES